MNKPGIVLQDVFLNQVRKDRSMVEITLFNGALLRGTVKGFDMFTIIMDCDGKQYMVYKHAVMHIMPDRNVIFSAPNRPQV